MNIIFAHPLGLATLRGSDARSALRCPVIKMVAAFDWFAKWIKDKPGWFD